mmetsp:Transcript_33835/g.79068  ORF Transcript_33835/g.79068 Transcript_33835/m.79068 type:complete len:884 (-) Transcript_33835:137-2788(-)
MAPPAWRDDSSMQAISAVMNHLRAWAAEGPPRNMRAEFAALCHQLEVAQAGMEREADAHEDGTQARSSACSEVSVEAKAGQASVETKAMALEDSFSSAISAAEACPASESKTSFEHVPQDRLDCELALERKAMLLEDSCSQALAAVAARDMVQSLSDKLESMTSENQALVADISELRRREGALATQVASSLAPVTAMCRVRPPETYEDAQSTIVVEGCEIAVDVKDGTSGRSRRFRVDRVIEGRASQEDVFAAAAPWVEHVRNGGSACLLAYGATGAGKTYTVVGDGDTRGVAHHALERLLSGNVAARLSVVEVYCDQIRDLLAAPQDSCQQRGPFSASIRRDGHGRAQLECTEVAVCTLADAEEVLSHGFSNRAAEATLCNERSSRSHVVVTVQLARGEEAAAAGRLVLVDLAGSENVQRSGADEGGKLLAEAKAINRSLSALADVVEATAKRQSFIPYRNSRLTMLLEETLCTAKVLLIAHVSPLYRDATDTGHSLQFAGRIRAVDFGAQQLRKETEERLKAAHLRDLQEIQRLQSKVDSLHKEKETSQQQEKDLKQQVAQLSEQLRETKRELAKEQEKFTKLEGTAREHRYGNVHVAGLHANSSTASSSVCEGPAKVITPAVLRSVGGSAPDLRMVAGRPVKAGGRKPQEIAAPDIEEVVEVAQPAQTPPEAAAISRAPLGDVTNSALSSCNVDSKVLDQVSEKQQTSGVLSSCKSPMGSAFEGPSNQMSPGQLNAGRLARSTIKKAGHKPGAVCDTDVAVVAPRSDSGRHVHFDDEVQKCSPPRWYLEHKEANAAQELENALCTWKPLFKLGASSAASAGSTSVVASRHHGVAAPLQPSVILQSPVLPAPARKKEVRMTAWQSRETSREALEVPQRRWR